MTKSWLPILVLVAAGLGALVWLDFQWRKEAPPRTAKPIGTNASPNATFVPPRDTPAPASPSSSPDSSNHSKTGNPLASLRKADLKDTVARPLFSPSRRRPRTAKIVPRPKIKKAREKPKLPTYLLLGIISDGERSIALLRKKVDGTNFRVEVGDMLSGWRVAKVAPKSILLERDDGTSVTLPLFKEE